MSEPTNREILDAIAELKGDVTGLKGDVAELRLEQRRQGKLLNAIAVVVEPLAKRTLAELQDD